MKKQILMMAAGVTALAAAPAAAQTKFSEGKVVYEISYEDTDIPPEYAAMMPKEMTTYIKKDKSRTDMSMGMGMNQSFIYDYKGRTMTMLMDVMGRKISVKNNEADVVKENKKKTKGYEVHKTGRTKDIAGYPCKHAEVKTKDGMFDLYYTNAIEVKDSEWANEYEGIDGFPMQYSAKENDMKMTFTATNVSMEKVPDATFAIPEEYKPMSMEEMMKAFGGGQ
jgi:GLPGLI family protein